MAIFDENKNKNNKTLIFKTKRNEQNNAKHFKTVASFN